MKLKIYQVDAFSEGPFTGNPAAVVPLDHAIDAGLMQKIAEENHLSETAFTMPIPGAGEVGEDMAPAFALRWFTPTTEVDLCGHATLGAAAALRTAGLVPEGAASVHFSTKSGLLIARYTGEDSVEIDLPAAISTKPIPSELAALTERALDVRVLSAYDQRYVLAVLESEEAVASLDPTEAALREVGKPVIATAPGDAPEVDFVSRFFAPTLGVPEDPVTGSAHCQLVPFWAATLSKRTLVARQISARGGRLECTLDGNRVRLAGGVHHYLSGEIFV
ncbi:putative isomerase YddE [Planctomycetes bacterium Poly30]|uniref:Putative isomerase YddE n=1 Tax=Saltatorellus ferox TaxID=2528018 RepID=A0A518ENM3_9BACT|nr:putative isomerase YddE [Planctomycetes bacterium Poly30]